MIDEPSAEKLVISRVEQITSPVIVAESLDELLIL
jgi:hypothetical protein